MALALLDSLTPWRRSGRPSRLRAFLDGPADAHVYIVHVGAGWALARLPLSPERLRARFDPVLAGWRSTATASTRASSTGPGALGAAAGAGQGRAAMPGGPSTRAWAAASGSSRAPTPGASRATIAAFPAERQARPVERRRAGLRLRRRPGPRRDRAAARAGRLSRPGRSPRAPPSPPWPATRAGTCPPHTELACQVLCGASAAEIAAGWPVEQGHDLPPDRATPAFEVWRQRIQATISKRSTARMNEPDSFASTRSAWWPSSLIAALYGFARLPSLPGDERRDARRALRLRPRVPLPAPPGDLSRAGARGAPELRAHLGLDLQRGRGRGAQRPRRRRPAQRRLLRRPAHRPGDRRPGAGHRRRATRSSRSTRRPLPLRPRHHGADGLPAGRLQRGRPHWTSLVYYWGRPPIALPAAATAAPASRSAAAAYRAGGARPGRRALVHQRR